MERIMDLRQLAAYVVERENMAERLADEPNVTCRWRLNKMVIGWTAVRDGRTVRQSADFQFQGICLDEGAVETERRRLTC